MQDFLKPKVKSYLLTLPQVVGVGYGFKQTAGVVTDKPAIVTLVTKKLPPELLGENDMIPRTLDGFITDVIEVGEIQAFRHYNSDSALLTGFKYDHEQFKQERKEAKATRKAERTKRKEARARRKAAEEPNQEPEAEEIDEVEIQQARTKLWRPAPPGVSIGHYQVTAGTFGAVVYQRSDLQPMILSNNHVLANATNGRDRRARINDAILQPGPIDINNDLALEEADSQVDNEYRIARLRNFVPLLNYPTINYVDAAIAKPVKNDLIDPKIWGIGKVQGFITPSVGMQVQKSGRTTGLTYGEIRLLDAAVNVNYGRGKVLRFDKQIIASNMSASGDSGSLVLNMNNYAVGLLFAGSSTVTVINPISTVLDLLKVRF